MRLEKVPFLTCGDQRNNRRGLDWDSGCPAVATWTEWAPGASVWNCAGGWVERSKDGILPSPGTSRKKHKKLLKVSC